MDNFQASENILTSAIENTKVGQSTAAAENFMFLELPAQFAGVALLSAGWRAAGAGRYLSGVVNNAYARIVPRILADFREVGVGQGFKSFSAFKGTMRSAGEGKAWHHIVEQTPENLTKFGAEAIHNTAKLMKLPHGAGSIHTRVSGSLEYHMEAYENNTLMTCLTRYWYPEDERFDYK